MPHEEGHIGPFARQIPNPNPPKKKKKKGKGDEVPYGPQNQEITSAPASNQHVYHNPVYGTNLQFDSPLGGTSDYFNADYVETRSDDELFARSLELEQMYKGIYSKEGEQYGTDMPRFNMPNPQGPRSTHDQRWHDRDSIARSFRRKYRSVSTAKHMETGPEGEHVSGPIHDPFFQRFGEDETPKEFTYNEAFALARNEGKKYFYLNGKKYDTRYAEESPEQFHLSFVKGTPEYKMREQDRTRRRWLTGYGAGHPGGLTTKEEGHPHYKFGQDWQWSAGVKHKDTWPQTASKGDKWKPPFLNEPEGASTSILIIRKEILLT